jgi:hypothetical protein
MEKYHTSLKGIKDDKEAVSRVQSAWAKIY